MANSLVQDIVNEGSELRMALRRDKLKVDEITEMLYRMPPTNPVLKMLQQCQRISNDLGDAIERASAILASDLLKAQFEKEKQLEEA